MRVNSPFGASTPTEDEGGIRNSLNANGLAHIVEILDEEEEKSSSSCNNSASNSQDSHFSKFIPNP